MPFPNSSLYSANFLSALNTPSTAYPKLGTNTLKVALYNDAMSQVATGGTNLGYTTTGEVTGSGYTAGGESLTGRSWALDSEGRLLLTASNTTWSTVSISAVTGCVIYDSQATAPIANPCIVAIKFGSAGSSGGGAFTIDWADSPSTNTIFFIDPTP
jgi:hypothetical protein